MGAEERWADRMEWAEEKRQGFDVEIKSIDEVRGEECWYGKCLKDSVRQYEVGQTDERGGVKIGLCEDHAEEETAIKIYREEIAN